MEEIGTFEAKTHLSELLERVRRGERITITRHGEPVAVLVPPDDAERSRASEALTALRAIRQRTRPGPESIQQLRDQGRRR